jgi:hypothetical protein
MKQYLFSIYYILNFAPIGSSNSHITHQKVGIIARYHWLTPIIIDISSPLRCCTGRWLQGKVRLTHGHLTFIDNDRLYLFSVYAKGDFKLPRRAGVWLNW